MLGFTQHLIIRRSAQVVWGHAEKLKHLLWLHPDEASPPHSTLKAAQTTSSESRSTEAFKSCDH